MSLNKAILVCLLLTFAVALVAEPLSLRNAALYSLLMPGMGEMYAGRTLKGSIFMSVEVGLVLSWFRFSQERDWAVDSYKQMALTYAGLPDGSPNDLYQMAQDYISSDVYNDKVIQDARNYFLLYQNDPEAYQAYLDANLYTGDETWHWSSERTWHTYKDERVRKQDMEIYANMMIGTMLLNRLISVIDAVITVRNINRESRNTSHIHVSPDFARKGWMLHYEYRF